VQPDALTGRRIGAIFERSRLSRSHPTPVPSDSWKSDASLLVVVLIWGANFPILKVALEAMPIHVLNVFRFIVSAGVLGGMYAWSRRGISAGAPAGGFFAPFRRHAGRLVVLAVIGYVLYQVCFVVGVNNTTAGSAALIMTSAPMWTAVIGRITGTEHLGRFAWLGLTVSMFGTALVVAAGSDTVAVGAWARDRSSGMPPFSSGPSCGAPTPRSTSRS
jgi:drug/metabolite transporter (DMT)-like permease